MAKLVDYTSGQVANYAPTPVEKYAINKYLVRDGLFNLMEFERNGMGSNIGNIQATILKYNAPDAATFRALGEEYDVKDSIASPVTLTLKMLGGEFDTDRVMNRAFNANPGALDNWTEQQIAQKINAIINGFAYYFINGNTTTSAKQFDGLAKYFTNNSDQVADALNLTGGLSDSNALQVEKYLNESIAAVAMGANVVITSRKAGLPFLQALESYRHRGVQVIKVGDVEYKSFMGMPIITLEDSDLPLAWRNKGIPVIFARFAEDHGIRTLLPQDGAIIDIVKPEMGSGSKAVFVKNGGVELVCVPCIEDYEVASICFINETPSVALDKETATVAAESTVSLTATTVPAGETVTWTTSDSSVATVSSGTVTGVAAGTAIITATVSGGDKATCVVTVTAE